MRLNPNKQYVFHLYFLLYRRKIVYIGITVNLPERLREHRAEKTFTKHRSFTMPDHATAIKYEKRWIKKFDPKYNTTHSSTPGAPFEFKPRWGRKTH
jgi:predicted GIY-YIG superfamily endonuclease